MTVRNEPGNNWHRGTGSKVGLGDTSACVQTQNAPDGCFSAPPDLLAFVHAQSVTEVARVLGMSRKTAWRLRGNHWPRDTRSVLRAWQSYKGRNAQQQSGWFLRRVYAGGLVRHAGLSWTANGMAVRTGQTVAVARTDANTLLAQTLDLPAERFELTMTEG